ncbi:MAG: phosphopantetheine-binding protein [Cellvibrionaceae bacterium]
MNDLQRDLKQLIIDALDLEDISVDDIESDAPLFVEGLGLDSIDALELGLALQKRYGVKIDADSEETKKHFSSVNSLAALVSAHQQTARE